MFSCSKLAIAFALATCCYATSVSSNIIANDNILLKLKGEIDDVKKHIKYLSEGGKTRTKAKQRIEIKLNPELKERLTQKRGELRDTVKVMLRRYRQLELERLQRVEDHEEKASEPIPPKAKRCTFSMTTQGRNANNNLRRAYSTSEMRFRDYGQMEGGMVLGLRLGTGGGAMSAVGGVVWR